jgi:hypothetical protein
MGIKDVHRGLAESGIFFIMLTQHREEVLGKQLDIAPAFS